MVHISRYLAMLVICLAVVSLVVGVVFIAQGATKQSWMKSQMSEEKVTYLLPKEEVEKGKVVDNTKDAQMVADTIREHRHQIAPTYDALLAGGKYDPTNPKHLTYSQAINMENYLYLAVLGFGVINVVMGTGAFMILISLALGATGVALLELSRRIS